MMPKNELRPLRFDWVQAQRRVSTLRLLLRYNAPCQHTLSTYPVNTPYQHRISFSGTTYFLTHLLTHLSKLLVTLILTHLVPSPPPFSVERKGNHPQERQIAAIGQGKRPREQHERYDTPYQYTKLTHQAIHQIKQNTLSSYPPYPTNPSNPTSTHQITYPQPT